MRAGVLNAIPPVTSWLSAPEYIAALAKTWRGGVAAALALLPAILLDVLLGGGLAGLLILWIISFVAMALWARRRERKRRAWFRFSSYKDAPIPRRGIREDHNACWFVDRHGFLWRKRIWFAGTGTIPFEFDQELWKGLSELRYDEPVEVYSNGRRQWWWFGERFFYEDQNYSAKDVQALILQAERQHDTQLRRAHQVMALENWDLLQRREPIPEEVQRAIWQRDEGRCVKCGSSVMIHIDHLIPVALGGSNHPDNLQLLCANCNREKSDTI